MQDKTRYKSHQIWPQVSLFLVVMALALVFTANAWLSDDAYITFRTVDNFVHGYGLTWNPSERVQAYTHPLWMLLLSGAYFLTQEIYFTSLGVSLAVAITAVFLLLYYGRAAQGAWVLASLILLTTKAFVDYTTSGLENPLSALLLIIFVIVYRWQPRQALFWLAWVAALVLCNRLDLGLLVLPPLGWAIWQAKMDWTRRFWVVLTGMLPVELWQLFSLFYYGFPFPNTAYAKLNGGLIGRERLLAQGMAYFVHSLRFDPVTLSVIGLVLVLAMGWRGVRWFRPFVAGIILYLVYIWWIGGDFMSGRFLMVPLVTAVSGLALTPLPLHPGFRHSLAALLLATTLLFPWSPLRFPWQPVSLPETAGITDEKANYWPATGLPNALHTRPFPRHDWIEDGQKDRVRQLAVVEKGSVGMYGYYVGPDVHVVDLLGLADPLLARLPPVDPDWRIGHLGRRSPAGYLETLATGENQIQDPNLAYYYDKLQFVTRGPLFSWARLVEIWRMNWGVYDPWLERFAWHNGPELIERLQLVNVTGHRYVYAFVWNNGSAAAYLLDEASEPGRVYPVTWRITANGATFAGEYVAQVSALAPLSDATTLNIGLILTDVPDLSQPYEIFEYRFWMRLAGENLLVARQGMGWHNEHSPNGMWEEMDVGGVIVREPLVTGKE